MLILLVIFPLYKSKNKKQFSQVRRFFSLRPTGGTTTEGG
jgi:hypothetical protein